MSAPRDSIDPIATLQYACYMLGCTERERERERERVYRGSSYDLQLYSYEYTNIRTLVCRVRKILLQLYTKLIRRLLGLALNHRRILL